MVEERGGSRDERLFVGQVEHDGIGVGAGGIKDKGAEEIGDADRVGGVGDFILGGDQAGGGQGTGQDVIGTEEIEDGGGAQGGLGECGFGIRKTGDIASAGWVGAEGAQEGGRANEGLAELAEGRGGEGRRGPRLVVGENRAHHGTEIAAGAGAIVFKLLCNAIDVGGRGIAGDQALDELF